MRLTAKYIKSQTWVKYKGLHISYGQNRYYITSLFNTHILNTFKDVKEYIKNFS